MRPVIRYQLNHETEIPQGLIDEAPKTGPFDEFAEYILDTHEVEVSLSDSIKILRPYGAWEMDELQDLDTNKARLLWLSILDCKENKTNWWYAGE